MNDEDGIRRAALSEPDIVDLAATLARRLLASERDERRWGGLEDGEVRALGLVASVAGRMPAVPQIVRSFLTEAGLSPADLRRRAFAVVDIVDALVGQRSHPMGLAFREPWLSLRRRLDENGRYNTNPDHGAVIPARGASHSRHRIGRRLCFTPPFLPYSVRYMLVSGLAEAGASPGVSVVPAPHAPRQVRHVVTTALPNHYEIAHDYTSQDLEELCWALREIEESGRGEITLFPEAAVDSAGFDRLLQEYRRLSLLEGRRGGINLLCIGHCGVPGPPGHNTVTILKRGGTVAWRQAKLNSYDLPNETIKRDGLKLPPSGEGRYRERLDLKSPVVTVADTPYGRLMVAICEDLGHLEPSLHVATEAGVSHLLVPLLDRGLDRDKGWYTAHVKSRSLETQCRAIVCTSAFMELHLRESRPDGQRLPTPVVTLLVHRPPWNESPYATSWDPTGERLWVSDTCPLAASE